MVRIGRETAVLTLIDVQERLLPVIARRADLLSRLTLLVRAAHLLAMPMLVTEQYPKGLGATVPQLRDQLDPSEFIEKVRFSCCGVAEFDKRLEASGRDVVVVAGIESHVCVQQTVLDLLERGRMVVVLADCVSSRHRYDSEVALGRMRSEGAVVTTLESMLFEVVKEAGSDTFKGVSKLVKELVLPAEEFS